MSKMREFIPLDVGELAKPLSFHDIGRGFKLNINLDAGEDAFKPKLFDGIIEKKRYIESKKTKKEGKKL